MRIICLLTLFFSFTLHAQTKTEVERINFFPNADAFTAFSYRYDILKIDTPQSTVRTKSVKNYKNLISLSYAHRFSKKFFLGLTGFIEEASENAVLYGIPLRSRFKSKGAKEPEVFLIYRLRPQTLNKGLVDLALAFSSKKEAREIGKENASRWNGRNILRAGLSHGMWENEWEFRSTLEYVYYGEGVEKNDFTREKYVLKKYNDFGFNFKTQYRYNRWLFIFGSVGVEYHSTQDIIGPDGEERQIQAGTGSVFEAGLKKPLSEWTILELSYVLKRNDYFVRGRANNLEGDLRNETIGLRLVSTF